MPFTNPTSLSATRNTTNRNYIDLSWPYTPNNGYRIYRQTNGTGNWDLVGTLIPTTGYGTQSYGSSTYGFPNIEQTTYQDTTTNIAQSYQYRIHVFDMESQTEVPIGTLSNSVSNLEVEYVIAGRRRYNLGIDVTWQNIPEATKYHIYRSENEGPFPPSPTYTVNSGTISINDNSTNHLKVYQYKVVVEVNGSYTNGRLSNILNAEPCLAVTNVVAVKNGNKIDVTWTNTEIGNYLHIYRGINGGPLEFLQSITPVTSTSFSDTNVQLNNRYRYGIIQGTITGGGVLAISNEESIAARVGAAWQRGEGTLHDEFFELSRKTPEINATVSLEFTPIFVGQLEHHTHEITPLIRTENPWQVIGESLNLSLEDTAFSRAKYYVYSVRARDVRNNWSSRAVASVQG